MTRVPPPWIIEEADPGRRRREEGERPRLEIPPPPPPPARSGEDEPEARVIVIELQRAYDKPFDLSAASARLQATS